MTEDRLRDAASWLPLAAGAPTRKLDSVFFLMSVHDEEAREKRRMKGNDKTKSVLSTYVM